MRRTLNLALASAAAVSLAASTQVSAAAGPLMIDMSKAFNADCTQERGAELVTGACQNGLFKESFIVGDAVSKGFPQGTVTFRKQPFKMGPAAAVLPNAANGTGQTVAAPKKAGYKYLQLLVTQTTGGAKKPVGKLVLTYTNKKTVTFPLKVNDWGGSRGEAAWTGPIQGALHTPAGNSVSSIFIEQVPLNSKSALASVKLPTFEGLRLFAMTLSNTSSALPKGPVFN